ncbi:MAG: DUF6089 family protein [Flavobacteriaceae bacterium]|nr:DUF6089 family protein [Flavobacteriaceae bacterium]
MMPKQLITYLFLLSSTYAFAQINETGVFLGGSNYIGDIGRTSYIYPNSYAVGGIYKWNMHPHYSIRATYTYSKLTGDDSQSKNSFRKYRDPSLSFTNTLHELAAGIEYHFFKYSLSKIGYTQTPYIIIGASVAKMDINNKDGGNGSIFSYSIPFGLGYKMKLAPNVGIAFETSFRYTFRDDIDGYPFQELDEDGNPPPGENIQINPNNNDWYVFTGITLVYAFGRGGCYTGKF